MELDDHAAGLSIGTLGLPIYQGNCHNASNWNSQFLSREKIQNPKSDFDRRLSALVRSGIWAVAVFWGRYK